MWGSRTIQARTPHRRYQRIQTCLPGEVESSSSPIRRQGAPDVRYPGGTSANKRQMRDIRVECQRTSARCEISGWNVGGQAPDERYPGGTSTDRIPDMRYLGGMRENFRPGEMSDAMCRKGPDPQLVVVQAVEGSSGQLHDHLVGSKI